MELLPQEICRLSAKQHVVQLIRIVKDDYSYFSEFMLYFYMMQTPVQRGVLAHIVSQVGGTRWERLLADEFRWRDLVRSILVFFSGSKEKKGVAAQPNKEELIKHLVEFVKSTACYGVDLELKSGPKKSFAELMEEVDGDGI